MGEDIRAPQFHDMWDLGPPGFPVPGTRARQSYGDSDADASPAPLGGGSGLQPAGGGCYR